MVVVFHKIYPVAHNGVHHNTNGFTLSGQTPGLIERSQHLVHVITIHFKRRPPKSIEFSMNIAQVHDSFCGTVDLLTVPVNRGDQIVNFMGGCEHNSLPILTLIQFPIAMKRIHNIFIVIEFLTKSSAKSNAHPLSQGAARHSYTRKMFMGGWMTLKTGIDFAEGG